VPRADATKAAADLRARFSVSSAPVPVEQIAVDLGIQVVRTAADWQESGFLLRDNGRNIIGINSRNSLKRQRFTIAHELGHWMLHEGKPLIVDQSVMINKRNGVSSQASDEEEIAANQFAAELLMPKSFVLDSVRQLLTSGVGSRDELIAALARSFDVSGEAMGWRLINLGLLRN
jgi:Zn-dependent peptidase ImmA (M78 family)